jgi:hypothetical protein
MGDGTESLHAFVDVIEILSHARRSSQVSDIPALGA